MFWQEISLKPDTPQQDIDRLGNHLVVLQLPRPQMFLASVTHILSEAMGFRHSVETSRSRWGDGQPVPMMSYALLEYLMGLDLRGFDVLEIGGGDSTEFWATRTKSVVTLEPNPQWAEVLARNVPTAKVEAVEADKLAARINAFSQQFGIVVIDPAANRARCARAAITKVAAGGFVILDNSDWYPNSSAILRDAGLIQIDFHDFRPLHYFRATTSMFLTPDFRAQPLTNRLPLPPIGGKLLPPEQWDIE